MPLHTGMLNDESDFGTYVNLPVLYSIQMIIFYYIVATFEISFTGV
jgi:hypothetical protein